MTKMLNEKQKEKLSSALWLKKQRDGVIGAVEEETKKLKQKIERIDTKIDELINTIKELVDLNDEIYDIEMESDYED